MKYIGIILFAIGIALLGLSFYTTHRIDMETGAVYEATESVTDNPLLGLAGTNAKSASKDVGTSLDSEAASQAMPYQTMARVELILGIVFIVAGVAIALTRIVRNKS